MLYNLEDTIAAITTPPGTGAVGVIRISGPGAVKIVDKYFAPSAGRPLFETPSHTLVHGWITDSGSPVDEVIVSLMLKPRSYTGDDTVEISAHAGPVILESILKLSLAGGARLAGPGEFTFRAFVNGKLDLAEAESVADLISSKTGLALNAALSHLKGSFSGVIEGFRKKLLDLVGALEAALDYAEEDIEFVSKENARNILVSLISEVSHIISSSIKARFLREGLRVAIIGKPNVGKSSLLNALLERERAIVTDVPGTTRDVLEEAVDVRGFPVVLIDTAGIRAHARGPVEKIGQNRTLVAVKSANVVLWVLDSSDADLTADRHISGVLRSAAADKTLLPVLNKSDLPPSIGAKEVSELLPFENARVSVNISTKTGYGLPALEDAIIAPFLLSGDILSEAVTANLRHIDAFERAGKALVETLASIDSGHSEEISSMHIREALSALGEITGETATEEILENIFKNFCVGK